VGETRTHALCEIGLEDGILVYRYAKGAEVDLDAAREVIALGATLVSSPHPCLTDIRGVRRATADARRYFSSAETLAIVNATALLVGGPVSRMLGNFFIGLNKPPVDIRIFDDEDAARAWLRSSA
jgi:hypothetical protein